MHPPFNLSRRLALSVAMAVTALTATNLSAAPDANDREARLEGAWVSVSAAGQRLLDEHGATPPLLPAARAVYAQRQAQLARGDRSYDLSVKCKPMGFPRVLWDGGPFDIQLQPKLVFMGYTWNRNHRTVDMGEGLPVPQIPRYYGTSLAHWDGDTLVVESAGFKDNTLLDAAGLPHSDALKLTERYTPGAAGNTLGVHLKLTDPANYSRPWEVALHFKRVAGGRILEDVCEQHAPFYKGLFPGNN